MPGNTREIVYSLMCVFCVAKEGSIQIERYSNREILLLVRESYHPLVEVFKVVCAVADVVFVHFIFKTREMCFRCGVQLENCFFCHMTDEDVSSIM